MKVPTTTGLQIQSEEGCAPRIDTDTIKCNSYSKVLSQSMQKAGIAHNLGEFLRAMDKIKVHPGQVRCEIPHVELREEWRKPQIETNVLDVSVYTELRLYETGQNYQEKERTEQRYCKTKAQHHHPLEVRKIMEPGIGFINFNDGVITRNI